MNAQEKFVSYLEDHPGYYLVAKSDLYISLLSTLEEQGTDILSISSRFPGIDREDLFLMLDSLVKLKLVGALKTNNKVIYYITKNAEELLANYRKTKTSFGVK
jgi:hypothetical protein